MEPLFSDEDRRDAQLEAIFRTHVADLYRYIYRQVKHAALAEDLTSAVFLKALRWLQEDRSSASVKGWLYATARSAIADYWHEQQQLQLLPLEEVEELPLPSEVSDEHLRPLQARIQHLLNGLSSRERDILTLRYLQGYNATEIGQMLGLSANHVRVLQLRALRRAALLEANERSTSMDTPLMPYNEQALRVLELTKEEARSLHHNYIGTEHLLLGILREGSAAPELLQHGITAERMRSGLLFIMGGERPPGIADPDPGFTPRAKTVLRLSGEEAQRLGETAISPYHLLVGILRENEGIAAGLLKASDVHWEQVGERVQISVAPEIAEEPITLPPDFQEALQQHPAAQTLFEKLPPSKQKHFIDPIVNAAREDARKQQVAKAIELLQRIHQQRQQHQ